MPLQSYPPPRLRATHPLSPVIYPGNQEPGPASFYRSSACTISRYLSIISHMPYPSLGIRAPSPLAIAPGYRKPGPPPIHPGNPRPLVSAPAPSPHPRIPPGLPCRSRRLAARAPSACRPRMPRRGPPPPRHRSRLRYAVAIAHATPSPTPSPLRRRRPGVRVCPVESGSCTLATIGNACGPLRTKNQEPPPLRSNPAPEPAEIYVRLNLWISTR